MITKACRTLFYAPQGLKSSGEKDGREESKKEMKEKQRVKALFAVNVEMRGFRKVLAYKNHTIQLLTSYRTRGDRKSVV